MAGLTPDTYSAVPTNATGGRTPSGSGRYVLYNGGTPRTQVIGDFPRGAAGATALTRARTAASVWGQRLWMPGTASGTITGCDLKTKKTVATYDVDAPRVPTDVQAVDSWLYWTCGTAGPAGVFNRGSLTSTPVPAGQARLADGYLVREIRTTRELQLTDFHSGTAVTRTIATLPAADANNGGYSGRWAVDKFGGHVAYLTGDRFIKIVPSGVPTSALNITEPQVENGVTPTKADPWQAVWQLSKPASGTLTLTNAAGSVVRTLKGESTGAAVRAGWDGATDTGGWAGRGTFSWKMVALARDGSGGPRPDGDDDGPVTGIARPSR